jgi:hypothetical protein
MLPGPTRLGAERLQRLDQDAVWIVMQQADARALERSRAGVLLADRHEPGHFGLGDGDFLATPVGERKVSDFVVGGPGGRFQCGIHTRYSE